MFFGTRYARWMVWVGFKNILNFFSTAIYNARPRRTTEARRATGSGVAVAPGGGKSENFNLEPPILNLKVSILNLRPSSAGRGRRIRRAPRRRAASRSSSGSVTTWATPACFPAPNPYRGTSLIRKHTPLGPYSGPITRVLGGCAFSCGRGTPVALPSESRHLVEWIEMLFVLERVFGYLIEMYSMRSLD